MSADWASRLADLVVLIHLLWVVFMVGGVFATVAGLYWRRLLRYSTLRWVHLLGLLFSAGLGVLGQACPLTSLEYLLRRRTGVPVAPESLIIRVASRLVFPDLDAQTLSLAAVAAAGVVTVIFLWQPPWRGEAG